MNYGPLKVMLKKQYLIWGILQLTIGKEALISTTSLLLLFFFFVFYYFSFWIFWQPIGRIGSAYQPLTCFSIYVNFYPICVMMFEDHYVHLTSPFFLHWVLLSYKLEILSRKVKSAFAAVPNVTTTKRSFAPKVAEFDADAYVKLNAPRDVDEYLELSFHLKPIEPNGLVYLHRSKSRYFAVYLEDAFLSAQYSLGADCVILRYVVHHSFAQRRKIKLPFFIAFNSSDCWIILNSFLNWGDSGLCTRGFWKGGCTAQG